MPIRNYENISISTTLETIGQQNGYDAPEQSDDFVCLA